MTDLRSRCTKSCPQPQRAPLDLPRRAPHPAGMRPLLLGLAATFALSTASIAAEPVDTAAALRDKALADKTAWTLVEDLTTEIGPRQVGSPAMVRAKDWGVQTLKDLGFTNIRVEEFAKPSWTRGAESASVVAPYPFKLSILGLGGTVPTPAKGIEAEVVIFRSYAELLAAPEGSLKGKIAVVTQAMTRTQDGQGYSAAGLARRAGPSEAARRGAIAYLVRSISTSDSRLAHTGGTRYAEGVAKIPAAALGVPDAELLERLAARGPVKVKLNLASTTTPGNVAWNISGDIVGSEKPEEVIVIGGHLDSWDVGTGAVDDASGIAITAAAGKLIGDLPRHPKRTIRVVMWGSEESGGSSEAFALEHKDGLANFVVASESDLGADRAYALMLPKGAQKHPIAAQLSTVLAPLNVIVSNQPATFGGSDTEGLQDAGVPVFNLRQDASRYFDIHHSEDDTLDKVDPLQLDQNVAAWVSVLYLIADSDIDFRALKDSQ